jgi:hypothetical protein
MNLRTDGADDGGNVGCAGVPALDHPQRDPLGAAGADARHALELRDERLDGCGISGGFHAKTEPSRIAAAQWLLPTKNGKGLTTWRH